jgi:hypothetical protein
MSVQNVVEFRAPELPAYWRQDELQQLLSLHSAYQERHNGASWSVGRTELGDPQFYLVGDAPELDCVMSVTRIGRLYVLEDGEGAVVTEDARLAQITQSASKMLTRKQRRLSFLARSLLGLCAFRAMFDQKAELMMAESMEHVSRFAPQLAALV